MSVPSVETGRMERLLANVLHGGTWLASVVIAVGLGVSLLPTGAMFATASQIVTVGIALLILLPVLRVILMLLLFLQERDYRFAATAAVVLAILFAGFAAGMLLE